MDTRIPRIALVAVLCLLMVSSAGVALAQEADVFDDFDDGSLGSWSNADFGGGTFEHGTFSYSGSGAMKYQGGTFDAGNEYATRGVSEGSYRQVKFDAYYNSTAGSPGFLTGCINSDTPTAQSGVTSDRTLYVEGSESTNTIPLNMWVSHTINFNWETGEVSATVRNAENGDVIATSSGIETGLTDSSESDYFDQFCFSADQADNFHIDTFEAHITPPVYTSELSGEVTDSDNEPIPDVNVTAAQDGTVVEYDETNDVGQYRISLENGTYNVTASKDGYRSQTETVTIDGSGVEQNFQLTQFNQSINLDTKRYIEHGQRADYRVIVQNDTGRHNVTGEATVTSGNESVVTVDTNALQLVATTNLAVNERTNVSANWTDTEGNEYVTQTNVTVANATVENLQILPTWTRVSASLDDQTLQVIIVATMIGAGAALLASSFAGLSASTGIVVLGWFAGMTSDGVLIVSFLMAIFIGLNLAGNVDLQVSGG